MTITTWSIGGLLPRGHLKFRVRHDHRRSSAPHRGYEGAAGQERAIDQVSHGDCANLADSNLHRPVVCDRRVYFRLTIVSATMPGRTAAAKSGPSSQSLGPSSWPSCSKGAPGFLAPGPLRIHGAPGRRHRRDDRGEHRLQRAWQLAPSVLALIGPFGGGTRRLLMHPISL